MAVNLSSELLLNYPPHFDWISVYTIYDLITVNDLEGIRSRLDRLTLRKRHSIAVNKVFNKTLLRYACERGFRDIVKYLLDECGLDISEGYTNRFIWLSPLIISIYNLDVSMVLLLISRGAVGADKIETKTGSYHEFNTGNFSMQSIFSCCTHGTSELLPVLPLIKNMALDEDPDAILRATAHGQIDEMKILRAYGINMKETYFSHNNALSIAILNRRSDAENFLLSYGIFTLKDHIRALDLCGAIFIACHLDIEQGLLCWKRSIRIRKEHFFGVSDKVSTKTKTSLGVEFTCEKELDMMANCEVELNIQALIVFVRLFPLNNELLHAIFAYVAGKRVFRNNLLQALKVLAALADFTYDPDRFDDSPSDALESLLCVSFSRDPTDISELLIRFKHLFDALNWFNWNMLLPRRIPFYLELYIELLSSLTKNITAMQEFDLCKNDKAWIKDGVSRIMQLPNDCYTTLLHTAVEEVATLPAIAFIVSCTTDANCIDESKQTPMHSASDLEYDEPYILSLVNLLADAGGHIDAMDRNNTTPYMMLKENDVIINPLKFLYLQCLAAQTIHKHNIEIPEIYPKILVSFLKLHSNDTVSTSVDGSIGYLM